MKRIVQRVAVVVALGVFFFIFVDAGGSAVGSVESAQAERDAVSLYKASCATCHGKDGRAKTFKAKLNGARNLADAVWQESVTDERIFNSISNGRGKKMPAFGNKYSQTEIESLVAHVRGFKKLLPKK